MCFPAVVSDENSQGLTPYLFCARGQKKGREWDILPPACWDETFERGKTSFTCQKGCSKCDLVKSSLLPKTPIQPAKLNMPSVFQTLLWMLLLQGCPCYLLADIQGGPQNMIKATLLLPWWRCIFHLASLKFHFFFLWLGRNYLLLAFLFLESSRCFQCL